MNAIQYALNSLRHSIPEGILQLTFAPKNITQPTSRWRGNNDQYSIDYAIRDKVIEGRVNIDCNLIGGTEANIDLTRLNYQQPDAATRIYTVPRELTQGRRIVSIRYLAYMSHHGVPAYGHGETNQLNSAVTDMMRAHMQLPIVATANCSVLGDNVVMIRDDIQHFTSQYVLVCLLENDAAMNNLNPGAYMQYAELVGLATKAYIYTHTALPMDQGMLYAGMSLGRVREIIDGYADANEQYKEHYNTVWRKVSFTNDRPRMNEFVRSLMGRGK